MVEQIHIYQYNVLQQYEQPQAMYLNPGNLFVAQFLGMPQINVFDGVVEGGKIICEGAVLREGCNLSDGAYKIGIRPESFELVSDGISVEADHVRMIGRDLLIHFNLGKVALRALVHSDTQIGKGSAFNVKARAGQIMVFGADGNTVGKF